MKPMDPNNTWLHAMDPNLDLNNKWFHTVKKLKHFPSHMDSLGVERPVEFVEEAYICGFAHRDVHSRALPLLILTYVWLKRPIETCFWHPQPTLTRANTHHRWSMQMVVYLEKSVGEDKVWAFKTCTNLRST